MPIKNLNLREENEIFVPNVPEYDVHTFTGAILGDFYQKMIEVNRRIMPENHGYYEDILRIIGPEILSNMPYDDGPLEIEHVLGGLARLAAAIIRQTPFYDGNMGTAVAFCIILAERYADRKIRVREKILLRISKLYDRRKITRETFILMWKTELLNAILFK